MEGHTTILMNGETVDLTFGLYALQVYSDVSAKFNKKMDEGRMNLAVFKAVLYAGYLCDCEAMQEEPKYKLRDFQLFVEQCAKDGKMDIVTDVYKVWKKSQYVKPVEGKEETEDEKKNQLTGTI